MVLPNAADGNDGHLLQDVSPRPNIIEINAGTDIRTENEILVEDVIDELDTDVIGNELHDGEPIVELFPNQTSNENLNTTQGDPYGICINGGSPSRSKRGS